VNRLHEGKEFGYIVDYRGVLGALDSAMALYKSLEEYDADELIGTLIDVESEVAKLPSRHSDVWALFGGLRGKRDAEPHERFLGDDAVRDEFYKRLSAYARTLAIALSSARFLEETPGDKIGRYKTDLKFFMNLRVAVKRRYAEEIDFGEYEPKIQKLIDTHVGTGEVETITPLVDIFDQDAFRKEVEALVGAASKADTIAHRTKKTISERMEEDPAFYKRFSEMLEDAIRAFREQRLSDAEYLNRVTEVHEAVRDRKDDDLPNGFAGSDVAKAFFRAVRDTLTPSLGENDARDVGADASVRIDEIIRGLKIVNWTTNSDVQNRMRIEIEDFLFELKKAKQLAITFDQIDGVMEQCIAIARHRYPQ
jgi:type I restriction enzyme R subunit